MPPMFLPLKSLKQHGLRGNGKWTVVNKMGAEFLVSGGRATQVWSNFQELRTALERHRNVLDDVMYHFKASQNDIDADVATLREAAQKARVLYLMRATQGQVG